jgi:hypothetical protein
VHHDFKQFGIASGNIFLLEIALRHQLRSLALAPSPSPSLSCSSSLSRHLGMLRQPRIRISERPFPRLKPLGSFHLRRGTPERRSATRQVRASYVPDRKTGTNDAIWTCQLGQANFVRNAKHDWFKRLDSLQ